MSITRATPWPWGPKGLKGVPIKDWPLTHVLAMQQRAKDASDDAYADYRDWIVVLTEEDRVRAEAQPDPLAQMPEALETPDPAEAALVKRESFWTLDEYADVLAHWLKDERVPAFVRAMVEAEWRAAKAQQAKRGKVVERNHLADMLGRLRRAMPQKVG